jgi:high affinity Mn2+ porin
MMRKPAAVTVPRVMPGMRPLLLSLLMVLCAAPARAEEAPADEIYALHGQATFVDQYHPAFSSPFLGKNSLDPGSRGDETFDVTLFAGLRFWKGGALYVNPELDQGFGLSDTVGVAGFPSGEAYKVGKSSPYFRLQRLFFRQTFDLGGEDETVAPAANQLGDTQSGDTLVLTGGKFSVTDIFDANQYAHDPKGDFMNWSLIDSGAFDYAADAWGYSYGLAAEWNQDWWSLRAALFDLSRVPNTTELETNFDQYEVVGEMEARHTLLGAPGKIKLLGFLNRGRMGGYEDALALAQVTGGVPDTALVRHYASRPGGVLNLEQSLSDDLGGFLRFSLNDGSKEAYEFTEINRSVALGLSLKGASWGRANDTLGLAFVNNAISQAAQNYLAAGGLGILIGDGRLPHYGTENILESYYSLAATDWLSLGADYQLIVNPGYDSDRGPVSVLGLRLHGQF